MEILLLILVVGIVMAVTMGGGTVKERKNDRQRFNIPYEEIERAAAFVVHVSSHERNEVRALLATSDGAQWQTYKSEKFDWFRKSGGGRCYQKSAQHKVAVSADYYEKSGAETLNKGPYKLEILPSDGDRTGKDFTIFDNQGQAKSLFLIWRNPQDTNNEFVRLRAALDNCSLTDATPALALPSSAAPAGDGFEL